MAGPLGGYDGVEMWTVRAWSSTTVQGRVVTSLHEWLHHELQNTTLWGLFTRFFNTLREAGISPATMGTLFWIGVMRSQLVHETYATALAVGVDAGSVDLLADNEDYAAHRARALDLLGTSEATWEDDRHVIDALLRSCMMARPLGCLVGAMPDVPIARFDASDVRPDSRLASLVELDLSGLRKAVAGIPVTMSERRELHDEVASFLEARGLPTLSTAEHQAAVKGLVERVQAVMPGIDIEIDDVREDEISDTLEELQRERIELHEKPLPVEVIPLSEAGSRPLDFVRDHSGLGVHLLAVWARADLLARQFALPNELERVDGHILALQAAGYDDEGNPVVRLATADNVTDLAQLAASLRGIEVIFFTTQASVLDAPDNVRFSGDQTIFILVDQPVMEQLKHTLAQEAHIRWARIRLGGDRQLSIFVFAVDALPHARYLHLATEAGSQALATWLQAQPIALTTHDPSVFETEAHEIEAAVQHVISAWWRLDQAGASRG